MPIVRANQPAMTRILPHPQNRRIAVPNRAGGAGLGWLQTVAEGDSVMAGGGLPNGISPAVYWQNPQNTTNDAVGGSTLATLAARISNTISNNPGADFIIHCGGNDARTGVSLAQMQTDTQTILTAIEATGVRIAWIKIPPVANNPDFAATPSRWTTAKDYNTWAEGEITSRGHKWIDNWPALEDPSVPETTLPAYLFGAPDTTNIHLSDAGAEAEALAIDQAIVEARIQVSA